MKLIKEGNKIKCGLLLALFIIFGLSLNVSSGVSALRYDYSGILYGPLTIPVPLYDSSSNQQYIDWDSSQVSGNTYYGDGLVLQYKGDAYQSSYSDLSVRYSASYIGNSLSYNRYGDFTCSYQPSGRISPIFRFDSDGRGLSTSLGNPLSPLFTGGADFERCNRLNKKFGDMLPDYSLSYNVSGLISCDKSNGAKCGGLWNAKEYIADQILPYSYTSSGFFVNSKAIDSNGIHYNNTFSFSDMFNNNIPTFSYLKIPLHSTDSFFLNSENLYQGRQLEFAGSFEFDGNFQWHENIDSNGSFFRVRLGGFYLYGNNLTYREEFHTCNTNLITIEGLTRLDYSCPFTLENSYVVLTPALEISGNDNYVWITDDDWRFASSFLVTDDDDTLANSNFNTDINGGGSIIGSAENNIPSDNPFAVIIDGADFSGSLMNLFGFTFINPFAAIFNLFIDQNSCVDIPIIAGMIHSEETRVCPWFDSNVRNIVTPVLGLASVMLVFGFAVRWLGSSSGNMFTDSADEEVSNQGGRWGHFKKGGN